MGSRGNVDHHGLRWALDEGGYQFAVTGLPYRVVLPGSPNMTLGDGVYVPWPNPRSNQRWEDVKPVPTGAMLREDTSDPANPRWPFFQVYTAENYTVAANLFWKYNIGLQVDGAPATETYRYKRDTSNPLPNQYKPSRPIYTSIASNEGQIRMAGAFMPAYGFVNGDVKYDRAPQADEMKTQLGSITLNEKPWSRKQAKYQVPDADWYHDATIIQVNRPDNLGTIPFVIMVDASSTFHAWPVGTTPQPGLADGAYADQSIKTNIPSDRSKTCKPPFPGWVYDTTDFSYRDFYASEGHQPFWPRYVWRFHPFENKVVGMCLQRTEPNYDVLKKVPSSWPETFTTDSTLSPASVYAKRKVTSNSADTTLYPIMEDTPGFAEFVFSIVLDPTPEGQAFNIQTCTFEFSMSLARSELAAETSYPIAAAYLNPVQGSWSERGVSAEPGELLIAYLRLYEHPKYRKDDSSVLLTGAPSFIQERFSRSFIDIKKASGTALATIPLMINDDFYEHAIADHNGTAESATIRTATLGQIMQLQLEEFSWLVRYEKTRIQPIEGSEFTVSPYPRYPNPLVSGVIYSNHPDHDTVPYPYEIDDTGIVFGSESEIGIRFVHRNVVRKEEQYGVNLGIWSTVDNATVSGTPLLLEQKRLLLYPTDGLAEHGNRLFEMLYHAYLSCEVYEGDPAAWSGVDATFARMVSNGFIANMAESFQDEWQSEWVDTLLKPFCEAALEEWVASAERGSTRIHKRIDRVLVTGVHPGDFFYQIPGYAYAPVNQKHRIERFNDGIHGYLRAWQFMVCESFRQYFHTGPDGSYALSLAVPHINSTQPATDPITGEIIGLPEPTKHFPVGVGFHRWGWGNSKTISHIEMMNDRTFLYELIDEVETHEPDLGRPFTPFSERIITLGLIDEIGFERGGHPVTSHLQLYKRAYQLEDVQIDVPEFTAEPLLRVRQYAAGQPILGVDTVLHTRDVTPTGGFLAERDRESLPPGLATIPGLTLYQGNATDIDTPRFNAGMHGVGFYLTGWHEYPE